MRFMNRCAVAAVAVSAALAVSATPAEAATGQLILRGERTIVVTNPGAGCLRTVPFSQITNNTNVYVTVYIDTNCTGFGLVVDPGSAMQVGERLSVRVPS